MMDVHLFAQSLASLNEEQQDAIWCDRNCVVTAGAGSGKTTVLSHRFLRLVVDGKAHVDEILTLTFSRLAAAEMFERIHAKLHAYAHDPDIRDELSRFGDATISTIDAFCNRVVSSDPLRYGIAGEFTMDDEANRIMAGECARDLCAEMDGHPGLSFLATVYSPDDLVEKLFVQLAVTHFHPSTAFDASAYATVLEQWLQTTYRGHVDTIIESYRAIARLSGSGKLLAENQEQAALVERSSALLESLADPHACLSVLEALKPKRCRGSQDFVDPCNAIVEQLGTILPLARGCCAAMVDRDLIGPVYAVLERLHDSYLAVKRERGILTFSDIAHMARDILLHNLQVRRHYQRKYRYIMIDEFQDTNQLQKDIVYLLAEDPHTCSEGLPSASQLMGDKLFFVGDEKQSIYRFRGADVSVFKQLDREIIQSGGRRIVLRKNYRSEPALIDCFNKIFERVMGGASAPYEAEFKPLEAREATAGIVPKITLLWKPLDPEGQGLVEDEQEAESVQAEAYAIANLINRMTGTDDYLIADRDQIPRRPRHEDIAILFRTSGNQMHFEKALRLAGIPYTLSALQSLFLESPANDLYLFLQLVIHPEDRLAFAGTLRSPFCRLSDDAVLQALDMMERTGSAFPSSDLFSLETPELSKYRTCADLYVRLCELAKSQTVASLVSFLWHDGAYRLYLLADPLFQVYLEHYDYLLELAIGFDTRNEGLPGFLDYLRPRLGQHENLNEIEPLRAGTVGVRLMTVHKSKGLEFPIVILANMGTTSRPMTTPAWHDMQHAENTVPVVRHMYPYGSMGNMPYELDKQEIQGMETAEMKRLFYVAATRAEHHLVFSGCENSQNLGPKAAQRNFLALLASHTGILGEDSVLKGLCTVQHIAPAPVAVLRSSVSHADVRKQVGRMRSLYQHPRAERVFPPLSVAVTRFVQELWGSEIPGAERLPELAADPILLEHGLATEFGTWCHSVLQRMIGKWQETQGMQEMEHTEIIRLAPWEFTDAVSTEALEAVAVSVGELARNFLTSDLYAQLLSLRPVHMESEVAFSMRIEDASGELVVVNGSIDLLVRYEDHIRVIDYKTDTVRIAAQHEQQLALYREAAHRLYGLPVFSTVCYLRKTDPVEWVNSGT